MSWLISRRQAHSKDKNMKEEKKNGSHGQSDGAKHGGVTVRKAGDSYPGGIRSTLDLKPECCQVAHVNTELQSPENFRCYSLQKLFATKKHPLRAASPVSPVFKHSPAQKLSRELAVVT